MATLSIISNFSLSHLGLTTSGKQGETTDAPTDAFDITTTGPAYYLPFSLATGAVKTLWDDDANFPATFDLGFLWTDQNCYLQLIGTATHVTVPVTAKVPYWITASLLAAANTTLLVAGATPSVTALDSILVSNVSGSAMSGLLALFD